MNLKDIRIGMKVVPRSGQGISATWLQCQEREQPYMYVIELDADLIVCASDPDCNFGDWFRASYLTLYKEHYTCNIPGVTVELIPGKEYWVSDTSREHAIRNKKLHKYVCTVKEAHIFEGYYTAWTTWKHAVDPDTYKEQETEMTVEEIAEALRKSGAIKGKLKIKE